MIDKKQAWVVFCQDNDLDPNNEQVAAVWAAGWDCRAKFEYELDLKIHELEVENKELIMLLQEVKGEHDVH